MYVIEMQFIPNMDIAWVQRLNPTDDIMTFDVLMEAEDKAKELQDNDNTGRKYRVKEIN